MLAPDTRNESKYISVKDAPRVILIAGYSCSGKTTLASRLSKELDCISFSVDDYYRAYSNLSFDDRRRINFDSPESIEAELLVEDLRLLKHGQTIHKPVYDFSEFTRVGAEPVYPSHTIIVEGLFSLYWPELNDLADLKIFVETDSRVCLARRLERDAIERGRSEHDSLQRYMAHVEPNQTRYVLPTKVNSDLVVSGELPLDGSIAKIHERLGTLVAAV